MFHQGWEKVFLICQHHLRRMDQHLSHYYLSNLSHKTIQQPLTEPIMNDETVSDIETSASLPRFPFPVRIVLTVRV
jgi:hypothetical protein